MVDGGVLALSGFFYQLLGSVAGLATAANDSRAVVLLEILGEDALLKLESHKTLQQFKYSAAKLEITPGDLATILLKLKEHDADSSCDWELCTNRPYSPGLNAVLGIGEPNPTVLAKVGAENKATIENLWPRLTVSYLGLSDMHKRLFERGRLFGLTDVEIADGADRLVGAMVRLVQERGSGVPIGVTLLDKSLVGIANPRPLHGPKRVPDLVAELNALASSHLGGLKLNEALPRVALKDLFRITDEPIVVVTGPGGYGKTLSVLRAIRDHVVAREVLGGMLFSDKSETLETLVASWRSSSEFQNPELLPKSMGRLRIANAGRGSFVLVLGLDGLDEHGWRTSSRRSYVRELVTWVRKNRLPGAANVPPLKLIITCRDTQDVDELLAGSGVGGEPQLGYDELELEVFDDSELREVWSKWFPNLVLPPLGESTGSRDRELLSDAGQAATAIDEQVIQALRHPTMLGCFRTLDGELQGRLLRNDDAAWGALLERYVGWFTQKAWSRNGLPRDEVRGMISECANATLRNGENWHKYVNAWIEPAVGYSGATKAHAKRLFEDALTSGLVVTDARNEMIPVRPSVRWRWRYRFVEEYLSALTAAQER